MRRYTITPSWTARDLMLRCQLQQLASMASRRLPAHLISVAAMMAWEA